MEFNKSEVLRAFCNKLDETGTISKNEILTFESSMGANVITSNLAIGSFSSFKTSLGVDKVIDLVKNYAEDETVNLSEFIDTKTFLNTSIKLCNKLELIHQLLTRIKKGITPELLDRFDNSVERYSFAEKANDQDDGGENEVIDLKEQRLEYLIYSGNNYLASILCGNDSGVDAFNKINAKLYIEQTSSVEKFPLLTLLSNNAISIENYSLEGDFQICTGGHLYELFNNIDKIIEDVSKLKSYHSDRRLEFSIESDSIHSPWLSNYAHNRNLNLIDVLSDNTTFELLSNIRKLLS